MKIERGSLNEEFELTIRKINKLIKEDFEELILEIDKSRDIENRKLIRTFELKAKDNQSILIFTINNKNELTYEIYLKNLKLRYANELFDKVNNLYLMSENIYLIGICKIKYSKFMKIWESIKLIKYEGEIGKNKCFTLLPDLLEEGSYYSFKNRNTIKLLKIFEWYKDREFEVIFTLEKIEFNHEKELNLLLKSVYNNSIKLSKCKINMTSNLDITLCKFNNSSFFIDQ